MYLPCTSEVEGSLAEIRTALGWANVPLVVHLALTLLMTAALSPLLFLSEETQMQALGAGGAMLFLFYGLASLVLGVWFFVVLLKSVGEVQGSSAWKAWGHLILCLLPFVALGVLAAILIPRLA